MRTNTKYAALIAYAMLAFTILLVQACGQPIAKDQGCPSDTYLANSTDSITGPGDVDYTGLSFFGAPYGGGSIQETPLQFIVTDSSGVPRENVCLLAYTGCTSCGLGGPFWYADDSYSTIITGPGPFQARILVTNDAGVARVFWASAVLPAGLPALVTGGTPTAPQYSAGKDQTGISSVTVQSGTKSAVFTFNWTVQGEPTP